MESLAKSPSSMEQEIANHLKAALKMVKIEPEELRSSRKYRVPIYVSEQVSHLEFISRTLILNI
jgi:hypothetical protein